MTISDNEHKVLARASRILEREVKALGDVLSTPDSVREMIRFRFGGCEQEKFGLIILNNRHQVIDVVDLFNGCIDSAAVYPRECVKEVLRLNGAACIAYHNHPSGVAEPSDTDVRLTRKLSDGFALLDIRLLDHLIVGKTTITSLAERGLM